MVWHQLFVKGNLDRFAMKKIDETINMFGGMVHAPEGIPVQEADGTWEVRILEGGSLSIAKNILLKGGLEIVREVENV
ncbi:MAG: hypothetical protein WCX74_01850 [Candidatus Paceibacterota bacterium]